MSVTENFTSRWIVRLHRGGHIATATRLGQFLTRRPFGSAGVLHARRRALVCLKANGQAPSSPATVNAGDNSTRSTDRVQRLVTLVELRRLYRNCLRAANLLETSVPVYQDHQIVGRSIDDAEWNEDVPEEIQEQQKAALELVAEMQLTAEQMKASLKLLQDGFAAEANLTGGPEAEARVRAKAQAYCSSLKERYRKELAALPFSSEAAAQAAVDVRNARFSPTKLASAAAVAEETGASPKPTITRLEQAEKVAEKFVSRRIRPALKRAQERGVVDSLRQSSAYLRGLWTRLNGGGQGDMGALLTSLDLPLPVSTKKDSDMAMGILDLKRKDAEKRLVAASAAREQRLRRAGPAGRVQMALESRQLDEKVAALGREVAVRSLQLEMEHVYRSLEDEALEIVRNNADAQWRLPREGSSDELALLVAEFGLLDEQLSTLAQEIPPDALLDNLLQQLGVEIPDMRARVGILEQDVYGGSGMSLTKVQLQIQEAREKLGEGTGFLLRGVRLLTSDLANAGRLFTKAALGGSLRVREVSALRRTFKDMLTFIPFIIILIIPLTPLGHVLVFSFIQRYFPQFFPSQFSKSRQEIMMRYEELKAQLLEAEAKAEQEEEEAELARATVAVARLTSPELSQARARGAMLALQEAPPRQAEGEAARKVKMLEEQLVDIMEDVNHGDQIRTSDDELDGLKDKKSRR